MDKFPEINWIDWLYADVKLNVRRFMYTCLHNQCEC